MTPRCRSALLRCGAPEQFVAALTDFGPGRAELFPNSTDDELEVHSKGPTEADVTEGSKGIWERLHYDWSDPDRAVGKAAGRQPSGAAGGGELEEAAAGAEAVLGLDRGEA